MIFRIGKVDKFSSELGCNFMVFDEFNLPYTAPSFLFGFRLDMAQNVFTLSYRRIRRAEL